MPTNTNPEQIVNDFDEAFTTYLRTVPHSLFGFYKQCKEEGFTDPQAFELIRDYFRDMTSLAHNDDDEC